MSSCSCVEPARMTRCRDANGVLRMHMTCVKSLAIPAGMFGLFLLWLPISLQAQLILSFAVLGVMFLAMTRPKSTTFRLLTFTFAGILAMRYAFWRTTETLPSIQEPLNFIPGLILYLAEMYCLAMLAISFFMLADPLKRKAPDVGDAASLPTVDVFIPSYNEEPELLAGTLAAAKSLLYPKNKLNVYLLDDGGTAGSLGAVASTTVHFAALDDDEIEAYIATGEPLRVAGAFTVDGLGGAFVTSIEGDHHNVVGLSLPLLRELVREVGVGWFDLT